MRASRRRFRAGSFAGFHRASSGQRPRLAAATPFPGWDWLRGSEGRRIALALSLALPALALWFHLFDAGWTSLYAQAVLSWQALGLVLVLGVGLLVPMAVAAAVAAPAILFLIFCAPAARKLSGRRLRASSALVMGLGVAWLALLAVLIVDRDETLGWRYPLLASAAVLLLSAAACRRAVAREWGLSDRAAFGMVALWGVVLALASVPAMLVMFWLLQPLKLSSMWLPAILAILTVLAMGLAPIFRMLGPARIEGGVASLLGSGAIVFTTIFWLLVMLGSYVPLVLKNAGIYDERPRHYLLRGADAAAAARAAGLAPDEVRGAAGVTVRGYQRFALGEVFLLCARPLAASSRDGSGCAALRREDVLPYLPAGATPRQGAGNLRKKRPRRMETELQDA
ncbi:hypothetical protein [Achromobacter sp. Marseille-Q4962]|uniref:hypothetical protein n=1 Tax=Achromobacter sp. Marseille-Q4962 TaxID=2942202 RepID=UPI0020742120|nr:hypothetical protein [Achromobacter sp. Marseille-Q4962]